jgi:hypothetical protein
LRFRVGEAFEVLGKLRISCINDFLILRMLWLRLLAFLLASKCSDYCVSHLLRFYLVVLVQVGKPARQFRAVLVISQEISRMPVAKPLREPIDVENGRIL